MRRFLQIAASMLPNEYIHGVEKFFATQPYISDIPIIELYH